MSNRLESQLQPRRPALATMLLLGISVFAHMGCLIPQEDQVVSDLPAAANRPLRIVPGFAQPEQRVSTVNLGTGCERVPFQVRVEDPNLGDVIVALWFIDPNDRYVAEPGKPVILGNSGRPVGAGSTARLVMTNAQFFTQLASFRGEHRVEVVVTDGIFIEGQRLDSQGDPQPFLEVYRDTVRSPTTGEVVPVEAFRDEYVWIVDVQNQPCNP